MRKSDLQNTKWDVRYWKEWQKVKWQEHMFMLGDFNWRDSSKDFKYLYADFYYLSYGHIKIGTCPKSFKSCKFKECTYEDLFPEKKQPCFMEPLTLTEKALLHQFEVQKEREYLFNMRYDFNRRESTLYSTQWDISKWTDLQKSEWQSIMIYLGLMWKSEYIKKDLWDAKYYFIDSLGRLTYSLDNIPDAYKSFKVLTYDFIDTPKFDIGVEIVKEDVLFTKWNTTEWTEDQKIKWQAFMFRRGIVGGSSCQGDILDKNYYAISQDGEVYMTRSDSFFYNTKHKECYYEDIFTDTFYTGDKL